MNGQIFNLSLKVLKNSKYEVRPSYQESGSKRRNLIGVKLVYAKSGMPAWNGVIPLNKLSHDARQYVLQEFDDEAKMLKIFGELGD